VRAAEAGETTMTVRFPMEVRVSPDVAPSRDRWSVEGMTTTLSPEIFSEKLSDFCGAVVRGLDTIDDRVSHYSLDAIEMHVELTSKGEIRLVAAAAAEVKGAIKLTFRTKRHEQEQQDEDERQFENAQF